MQIVLRRRIQGTARWVAILTVVVCVLGTVAGCGSNPQKPAGPGGGRMQPYNPNDGTYK